MRHISNLKPVTTGDSYFVLDMSLQQAEAASIKQEHAASAGQPAVASTASKGAAGAALPSDAAGSGTPSVPGIPDLGSTASAALPSHQAAAGTAHGPGEPLTARPVPEAAASAASVGIHHEPDQDPPAGRPQALPMEATAQSSRAPEIKPDAVAHNHESRPSQATQGEAVAAPQEPHSSPATEPARAPVDPATEPLCAAKPVPTLQPADDHSAIAPAVPLTSSRAPPEAPAASQRPPADGHQPPANRPVHEPMDVDTDVSPGQAGPASSGNPLQAPAVLGSGTDPIQAAAAPAQQSSPVTALDGFGAHQPLSSPEVTEGPADAEHRKHGPCALGKWPPEC